MGRGDGVSKRVWLVGFRKTASGAREVDVGGGSHREECRGRGSLLASRGEGLGGEGGSKESNGIEEE